MKTLADIGERGLVAGLASIFNAGRGVVTGIGHDCAILRVPGSKADIAVTTDAVIEGVHFRRGTSLRAVGHKAMARALSDLAATGAEPAWALLDLVAPPSTSAAAIGQLLRAVSRTAARYGVSVVGGDTARGDRIELHAFAIGFVPRSKAILRSGARPGDAIYVTGHLGFSGQGRHLSFEPRVKEGLWLRQRGYPSAMTDVSDGLATDLAHLCEMSGCGAVVCADCIPCAATRGSRESANRRIAHALCDGEDFELLFTVPAAKTTALEKAWRTAHRLRLTRIGEMTRGPRVPSIVMPDGSKRFITRKGYDHFA